jgi:hypothetical protein
MAMATLASLRNVVSATKSSGLTLLPRAARARHDVLLSGAAVLVQQHLRTVRSANGASMRPAAGCSTRGVNNHCVLPPALRQQRHRRLAALGARMPTA